MKLETQRLPLLDRYAFNIDLSPLSGKVKLLVDTALWTLATPLAFVVRYDAAIPADVYAQLFLTTLLFVAVKLMWSVAAGLQQQSWAKIAFRDLTLLLRFALGTAAISAVVLLALPFVQVPPTLGILDAALTLMMMLGVRASARYLHERRLGDSVEPKKRRCVLVIGAGEAGSLAVREMLRHPETGMRPVGFLDDDWRKQGSYIASVPVLGTTEDLGEVVQRFSVDEILIAIPSADGRTIRAIVDRIGATKAEVKYRTIPGIYELLSGQVDIKRIREVGIEDLLRRPPVRLDSDSILGYLQGKTVMVTGAGGSIGSELVRQICRFQPKELILFGHGENSIFQLERELDRDWPDIGYHSVIGAIQNGARLDYVFRRYKPQVIFHTAAHKHVPLMELNPEEAIFNNVVGSRNLINLALKYGISHFVNISTDKAVNPSSVMGASKRIVERLVESASQRARDNQIFVSVRFGNVLGSRGSVIPLFKKQIMTGGPVTVTHPDMVRYFMTIPEAVQLVLQASAQGRNGEIYILDMGQPVKILDLARDLIKLSGFEPDVDIPIVFSGVRPGEKLIEELMTQDERGSSTAHEKIFVAKPRSFDHEALEEVVEELQASALGSDHARIRMTLESFIQGCHLDREAVPDRLTA